MGAKPNPLGNVLAMKGLVRNASPDLYNGMIARWGGLLERVHDRSGGTTRLVTSLEQEEGTAENRGFGGTILKNANIGLAQIAISAKSGRHPCNPIPVCRNAALVAALGEASSEITRVKGNSAGQSDNSLRSYECPLQGTQMGSSP